MTPAASIPPVVENTVALAFIVGLGYVAASRLRTLFGDDRQMFSRMFWQYGAVFGERLGAAIDRRTAYETVDRRVVWMTTGAIAFLYWLYSTDVFSKPNAIALGFAVLVGGTTLQALTTKRNGKLHIAALEPRDPQHLIPAWFFVVPAVVWCGGVVLAVMHHAFLTIGIALLASLGTFYASFVIAAAPAIITSDDPQMDAVVDLKVRAYRMRFVLLIGSLAPLALATALEPLNRVGAITFAFAVALIAWWVKRQGDFTASEIGAIVSSSEGA